ncbi:MAG: Uma2 family endonuclease [Hyphomicrobiaceae bacterium]
MTTTEFLRWEGDGTETKYELVDGQLVAMSPATTTHGTIQANLALVLGLHLRGSPCRVITEAAVVPRVASDMNTRVPDLAVTCSPDIPGEIGLTDPVLVIEILSAGNKSKTWSNVWAYASIPSVREILILSSWSIEGQLLRRDADGAWPEKAAIIPSDGSIALSSLDMTFLLRDAYAKTFLDT